MSSIIISSQDVHDKSGGAKPKVYKDGQYSDPLYKKLSKINGEINKLSKPELQTRLKECGLDSRYITGIHISLYINLHISFADHFLFFFTGIIHMYIVLPLS